MIWFTIATLTPVALLTAAALAGGIWPLAALLYLTGFTYAMDRLVRGAAARRGAGGEFPAGDALSVTLGLAHLALVPLAVWAIGGPSGLSPAARVLAFFAFGLFFGQVSNANAHELIHRAARWPRRLGTLVYITLLFGHHASAHPLVHHVHVATPRDPNSARKGESFYRFWPRAWIGSFREGLRAETARRARAGRPLWTHPYIGYVGGALALLAGSVWLAGPGGAAALVGVAVYAQMQLLVSDYVQHYGLSRPQTAGRPAPVGPGDSWNSPHMWSSALMLNAPRHSDHHLHPARRYPSLTLDTASMPILPRSLPVMGAVALVPPLFHRMMAPRLAVLSRSRQTAGRAS
ncbi:alkane 1-monooxygenase [Salinihabitans flavidus]|uniref:Alkane 1-monooxygenase n=1 Tax=Salinihabitans flavidus TaxID=569882 RepID=A0A1H8LBV0_9RHOB|nr:alkane 1-monooxygenase [Salinihabitans flavidus]SEO02625.1 alkane 1-monooxygenase [Salinihabitans flavidus]